MSSTTIENLLTEIRALILELINQKIQEGQLALDSPDISAEAWKEKYLWRFSSRRYPHDPVRIDVVSHLLDWIVVKLADITAGTFDPTTIKYLTCNVSTPRPIGQIAASAQNLIVSGAGVKPTVPSVTSDTPINVGFNLASDILPGQWALNITDNKWYFRKGNTIYELKEALNILIADIPDLQGYITDFSERIGQLETDISSLGISDITGLTTALGDLTSAISGLDGRIDSLETDLPAHTENASIHFEVDGTTITITDGKASVDSDSVKDMIEVLAPLSKDVDKKIQLDYDSNQFEVIGDILKIKEGAVGVASDSALGVVMIGAFMSIDGDGKINPALANGLLAYDATNCNLVAYSSKDVGVIYEIDLGSPVLPDDEDMAIGYNGIFYATKFKAAAGDVLTKGDISDDDIAKISMLVNDGDGTKVLCNDGTYKSITDSSGVVRATFTNADLDVSLNYVWTHGAGDSEIVITVFDNNGQIQPLLYKNDTSNQSTIYVGKSITGTWKLKGR